MIEIVLDKVENCIVIELVELNWHGISYVGLPANQ